MYLDAVRARSYDRLIPKNRLRSTKGTIDETTDCLPHSADRRTIYFL
jgi:hypothetical protein